MSSAWWLELRRVVLVLLAALVIGGLSGAMAWSMAAAVALIVVWHGWQLQRLRRWLMASRRAVPPEASGVWADIYDQFYHLQRRNRQRKQRLAAIVREFQQSTAAMPDGTVVLAPDGTIAWFNSAAQRLLELRAPEDLGQRILNLLRHPAFVDYFNRGEYEEALEIDSPYQDGVRLTLQVIPYGQEQRLLLVRDVTRLYRLEQVRRDFVANASHELRTPLTVIGGYLESMQEDDDPALGPWRAPVGQMHVQARRMQEILEDLLTLSRLDAPPDRETEKPVAMATLARQVCADNKLLAEDRQLLDCQLDQSLGVRGVEKELRSAIANLVQNAVKYTPEGGRIDMRWRGEGDEAVLEVEDTGPGIPARHIPRLTERFYRVDEGRAREQGGTGLGLSIVRHVLLRHDATLEISSTPGKGSVFCCRFPAHRIVSLPAAQ